MSGWNVVDSSAWLEYLIESERAELYSDAITDIENLIVPVISVYEVVKRVRRDGDEEDALNVVSAMSRGQIVDLDLSLALESTRYKLPLADSIIYATAQTFGATLWTQDEHFKDLAGVHYFPK